MTDHQVNSTHERQSRKQQPDQDNVPLQAYIHHEEEDDICIASILKRSATARRNNQEEEELRFAMQRAWAVLDGPPAAEPTTTEAAVPPPLPQTQPQLQLQPPQETMVSTTGRIQTLKTLTTRIYIDDVKTHKVVQLTNVLTTAMVVQYLKKKGLLDSSDDWTLFEIDNSHGVERPIREWEIVLDILTVWGPDASNALLVKKYSYHYTLITEAILHKKSTSPPPMHGWLSIEYKKGKWQKRYCFIKDHAIHHAKDNNKTSSSILCHLNTYDVYTLLLPLKASPTPFVFAIRAQDKANIFEREGDYMRCLATHDQEEMKDWVLSIRFTKSQIQYQAHPNRVINPLAHVSLVDSNLEESTPVSRHKSTSRDLPKSKVVVATITRSGTTTTRHKQPTLITLDDVMTPVETVDEPTFSKGSLLAKEETPEQILYRQQQQQQPEEQVTTSNTLIHIHDGIRFAKGSLLDVAAVVAPAPKITRSKSVREVGSSASHEEGAARRHQSLKRRPTNKKHHDVPLPSSPPPATPSSTTTNNNTLLQLDDSPERFHSRELHGRHVKPLLNFDSPSCTRK